MKCTPLLFTWALWACGDASSPVSDVAVEAAVEADAQGEPEVEVAAETQDAAQAEAEVEVVETVTEVVETIDVSETTPSGSWDPGDDRVTFAGTCTDLGRTCTGSALVDCNCLRDADGDCIGREAYRIDCARIYPEAATCAEPSDGRARCGVLPGGRCLFTSEELGLPEANPLWTLVTLEQPARGIAAPCIGESAGCVIEADGVGRCREHLPACAFEGQPPTLPAVGECDDSGTLAIVTCSDDERGTDATLIARDCSADSCGVTCAGLPDGAPCTLASTYGAGQFYWFEATYREHPCGPFSRCGAAETCEPRTCDVGGDGACTNAADCGALAVGLASAFDTLLACIDSSGATDPAAWSECLRAEVPISAACAACFTDLSGDFEACAGF